MGRNKQQTAAKKQAAEATEQPKQEAPTPVAPTATPTPANKQTAAFDRLKAGWEAKGVDLSKMTVKPDGKFTLVVVGEGWPTVRIGVTGGLTVVELKSYVNPFDAAMIGKELFEKQKAREAKKAAAAAPAPAAPKAPAAEKQLQTA
jgi:hypothetical protein